MKVLISDPIAQDAIDILKGEGLDVDYRPDISHEELLEVIKDYHGIIVRSRTKVREDVIERAEKLKVIGRAGVGLDNIDLVAAEKRGIVVVNTPGATSISVAELTIGLMLSLFRFIPQAYVSTREGRWEKKKFKGRELFGKTLGLIGVGRIGREVAKRCRSFGMKILAYDPYLEKSDVALLVSLDELLEKSDVISIHTPLTPETKGMVNGEFFEKMKDGAVLINCARGGIVNEDDLYEALKSGKLSGAAMDVYEVEPPGKHKLFTLENFIGTPHIGAQAEEGQLRAGQEVAKKVAEILKGGN